MSRHSDPIRITDMRESQDDLAELSSGIRGLRKHQGSAAQADALAARLGPELATNVVAGTALLSSALLRFVMLGVGIVGVSVGAWWLWGDRVPVASAAPRSGSEVAALQATERAPALPELGAVVEPAPEATAQAAEPVVVLRARAGKAPARTPAPRSLTQKHEPIAHDPEAELALLGRAQALLDSDPNGALNVLGEHSRSYARGVFSEEREVLALEAESKLGHKALARARAGRFMERFPRSAHARRVRTLLEPTP